MKILYYLFAILFILNSCNQKVKINEKAPRPSVKTIHPKKGNIQEYKQLNGQVIYLNKNTIKAPISGYVTEVNIKMGSWIEKDELLFKIQSKESQALQNKDVSVPDNFGVIKVIAGVSGFVNSLNITDANVYISEGNVMASIVKNTDLVIQVNTPFEFSNLLLKAKDIEIELPNHEVIQATFYMKIPKVDPISQTQQIYFKLNKHISLPESLNVLAKFHFNRKKDCVLLPKAAVLTNETQDQFWIMKVNADTLAIKLPITKGIENDGQVEILNPPLQLSDEIIISGGYELPDSTKVKMK